MKSTLALMLLLITISGAQASSVEFKVLSLNTWMIPGQRKMAAARAQAIGRQIGDYDLALLQEAFTGGIRKTIATVAKRLGNKFYNRYETTPILKLNSGKFSLSKFPITKSGFKRFTNCAGIQCMAGKGVLYIQVKLPDGQLVDIFNTHFQADEKSAPVRIKNFKTLREFVDRVNQNQRPVIVAGDFNVISQTSEYDVLKKAMDGFVDTYKLKNPDDEGYTWNPDINNWAYHTWDESFIHQRLDYIFVRGTGSKSWNVKNSEVVLDQKVPWIDPSGANREIFVADHFGVATTLVLE